MSRIYDRPIVIQAIDPKTEEWADKFRVHARINKARGNNEYLNAGAVQAKETLTFEVRYFAALEELRRDTQSFRIVYMDQPYNITDYDDYMMNHKTVKLLGASYQ